MKRSTRNILLLALAIAVLLTPIYIKFFSSVSEYEGTDDRGSQIIETLSPDSVRAITNPSIQVGYEPTETNEVWLFVGQIALGVLIFGLGLYALDQYRTSKESSE